MAGSKARGLRARGKKTTSAAEESDLQPPALLGLDEVLAPELLKPESRAALHDQYQSAEPYTHCRIEALCKPDILAKVRDEIVHNINATYKETDLFKVIQTGDLGNLDKLDSKTAAKLPTLMSLKAALYSEEFRAFVREVTGCGELADKTDCSCNIYTRGGHLLCHDDVIGTRRVSYIIYLTDPDEPWTEQEGGALELYPLEQSQHHTPAVHPSRAYLPTFNSMVMFTVLPGKSFHSVQEVLTADKPRMAISGWYHAPHEPEDYDKASLAQLQQAKPKPAPAPAVTSAPAAAEDAQAQAVDAEMQDVNGGDGAAHVNGDAEAGGDAPQQNGAAEGGPDPEANPLQAGQDNYGVDQYLPFTGEQSLADASTSEAGSSEGALSEEDLSYLIRYINPTYLQESVWPRIAAAFAEEGSLQLKQFLSKSWAAKIAAAVAAEDKRDGLGNGALPSYQAGVCGGWQPVGPPHKQRYLSYTAPAAVDAQQPPQHGSAAGDAGTQPVSQAGKLMAQVRDELFTSAPFARLLRAFTTIRMLGHRGEVRRFRPGLDYTVAHYGILTKDPRLDVVLCFVGSEGQPQQPARQTAAAGDANEASGGSEEKGKGGSKGKAKTKGKGKAAEQKQAAQPQHQQQQPQFSAWDDGEVGGFEAYLLADEDAEGAAAAEVYRQDAEDSGVLNVSAANNSLNLVLRDEGLMKFVKYVSAAAPGSRWDIAMEYLPEDDSDDEEEEQEEGGKQEAVEQEEELEAEPAAEEQPAQRGKGTAAGKGKGQKGGAKKAAQEKEEEGEKEDGEDAAGAAPEEEAAKGRASRGRKQAAQQNPVQQAAKKARKK